MVFHLITVIVLERWKQLIYFLFDSSDQEKLKFSYCQGLSVQRFIGETIGQRLDKTVDRFPDREAYVFCEDNQRATFADFQEEVRVASGQRWCRLIQDTYPINPVGTKCVTAKTQETCILSIV